jgi:hypothetical protein
LPSARSRRLLWPVSLAFVALAGARAGAGASGAGAPGGAGAATAATAAGAASGSVRASAADPTEACAAAAERAQLAKHEGRLRAAREDALACAQERCPRVVRRDCDELYQALEASLPTVMVVVRDGAGADVSTATVRLDDGAAIALDGKAVAIDPGSHVLQVSAPGFVAQARTVVLGEGEKRRRIEFQMVPAGEPAAVRGRERSAAGPIVLGSIGIAALGTFAGFGIASWSRYRELRDQCGHGCAPNDVAALRRRATIADVSLGVGVATLGAAAIWWWWPSAGGTTRAAFGATPTPGGLAATAIFVF